MTVSRIRATSTASGVMAVALLGVSSCTNGTGGPSKLQETGLTAETPSDCPTTSRSYSVDDPVSFADWSIREMLQTIEVRGSCTWDQTAEDFEVLATAIADQMAVTEVQRYDDYFEYCSRSAGFTYRLSLEGTTFSESLVVPGDVVTTPYQPFLASSVDIESPDLPGGSSVGTNSLLMVHALDIDDAGSVGELDINLFIRDDLALSAICQ
jgi:hypothetical protein